MRLYEKWQGGSSVSCICENENTGIPQRYYRFGSGLPLWSKYHNKEDYTNFLFATAYEIYIYTML